MSFLSIDQRRAALNQMDDHIAALTRDADELVSHLAQVHEYRKLQRQAREQIRRSMEGELTADELEALDVTTRERLVYGIVHYPVKVCAGDRVTVRGRAT